MDAYLPQVSILRRASVLVTHAGNNSVTEALAHGVPMLALPFSTDQFDGAAAIEAAGLGLAADPNCVTPNEVAEAVRSIIGTAHPALDRLAAELAVTPRFGHRTGRRRRMARSGRRRRDPPRRCAVG